MKIMLVEDDYSLNKVLSLYFTQKGKTVDSFLNGLEAYENLNNIYDVYIIDIDIPEISGIELLKQIKDLYSNAYVIMISATVDIDMIEKAYKIGCNDYLKKPFNRKELELKLQLIEENVNKKYFIDENTSYDINKSQILTNDNVIKLTAKESKLFQLLLNNRNKIISTEHIIDVVWDNDAINDQVRKLVSRLNKKLPKQLISNKIGLGYIIE